MKPFKARYTESILKLSSRFPLIFSKRIRQMGADFNQEEHSDLNQEEYSEELVKILRQEHDVKIASLFSGPVIWKGMSFVVALDRSELKKVHKWMSSQKSSPWNFSDSHRDSVDSKNLMQGSFNRLGLISFGSETYSSVANISLVSELPKSCFLSSLTLQRGVTYLSLYIELNETASKKVFNVNVEEVDGFRTFQSINPFSRKFSVMVHRLRGPNIDDFVCTQAKRVISEAESAVSTLMRLWDVKKDISEFSTVADFSREGTDKYFIDSFSYEENAGHSTVIPRWRGEIYSRNINLRLPEELMEGYLASLIEVNAIFIKSECFDPLVSFYKYSTHLNSIDEYYGFIMCVYEVDYQLQKCMKLASPVFFGRTKRAQKMLDSLLKVKSSLTLIDERLLALEEMARWLGSPNHIFALERIQPLRQRLDIFKQDVERRNDINNSLVQSSNLVWMRRYSIVVFFFVVIQVCLAAVNVDWTESGREKNPIYLNFSKLWRELNS